MSINRDSVEKIINSDTHIHLYLFICHDMYRCKKIDQHWASVTCKGICSRMCTEVDVSTPNAGSASRMSLMLWPLTNLTAFSKHILVDDYLCSIKCTINIFVSNGRNDMTTTVNIKLVIKSITNHSPTQDHQEAWPWMAFFVPSPVNHETWAIP